MTNKQALEQVKAWRDLFHYQKDEESENARFKEGFYSFKSEVISLNFDQPDYRTISDLMIASGADEDSRYSWMVGILDDLIEQLDNEQSFDEELSRDKLQDHLIEYAQNDAPIYNSELCEWMSKGTNWVFVDEAIDEFGATGGIIQLIQMGYAKGLEEMYYSVIEQLEGGDSDE
jgi:hypothetical protein